MAGTQLQPRTTIKTRSWRDRILVESEKEPVTEFKERDCPFRDERVDRPEAKPDPKVKGAAGEAAGGDATVTVGRLGEHTPARLANFAPPRAVGNDNNDENGHGNTTNLRAVSPTTVLDSIETEEIEESGFIRDGSLDFQVIPLDKSLIYEEGPANAATPQPPVLQSPPWTMRNNEYFLPRDGIHHHVIMADICHYLGNDVLVRPGYLEVRFL